MPRRSRGTENERAADGRRIYSLGDVTTYAAVPRPQAQYWLKHRVIVPDYEAAGGPGNYHGFTFRNLIEFEVARRLSWVGLNGPAIKGALEALRFADPDDWYGEMPRMLTAVNAVLKKKKPPTKTAALKWLDQHKGPPDWTDPVFLAELHRHAVAANLYAEEDHPLSEEEQRELVLWRQFKDPRTRAAVEGPVVLRYLPPGIVFSAAEAARDFGPGIPAVLLHLTSVFEHLESATGDYWNNLDWQA